MRHILIVTIMVLVLLPEQQAKAHAAHTHTHTHTPALAAEYCNSSDSLHLSDELRDSAKDDVSMMEVGLLTVQVQMESLQSLEIDPSFNGKLPIEWVHVPKAGSSFLQTLLHIQGICPGLPPDFEISSEKINNLTQVIIPALFQSPDPEWKCNASAIDLAPGRRFHAGIEFLPEGGFNAGKGHFMMMMRQPEQRLLSNWQFCQTDGFCLTMKFDTLEQFKVVNAGCVTKMLTRAEPIEGFFLHRLHRHPQR